MDTLINPQLAALFNPSDIVALKQDLQSLPSYIQAEQQMQFFCINPLKEPGKLVTENIAEYRNILVEMDKGSIEEQWKAIEKNKLPWTTCVYSGGKSLHFIISIKEGIDSLYSYTKFAKVICKALDADTSVTNPNRLSRLAGSIRIDNGVEQELIEVRPQISIPDLIMWRHLMAPVALRNKMDKIEEEMVEQEFATLVKNEGAPPEAKTILPNIYSNILHKGALHPECTSRHQSLVKFGVWLKDNWHAPDEIKELLRAAQVSLGISEREKDLTNLLKWLKV